MTAVCLAMAIQQIAVCLHTSIGGNRHGAQVKEVRLGCKVKRPHTNDAVDDGCPEGCLIFMPALPLPLPPCLICNELSIPAGSPQVSADASAHVKHARHSPFLAVLLAFAVQGMQLLAWKYNSCVS